MKYIFYWVRENGKVPLNRASIDSLSLEEAQEMVKGIEAKENFHSWCGPNGLEQYKHFKGKNEIKTSNSR